MPLVGCRDLVFEDGHRLSDDHVLGARPPSEGGPGLTEPEQLRRWFQSESDYLSRLEGDLRTRVDFHVGLKSTMAAWVQGQATVRDPRAAAPTRTTVDATLGSPVMDPIAVHEVLRNDDNNPGELQTLCAHPIIAQALGSCPSFSGLEGLPYDDLHLDLDADDVEVAWDEPRQTSVMFLRDLESVGSCADTDEGFVDKCADGYRCPRDAANQAIAGACEWTYSCDADSDCVDPACAVWGGCEHTSGATHGTCDAGSCSHWLEQLGAETDRFPDVPVLTVTMPLNLDFDPEDGLGALFDVDLERMVVELRLQPDACHGDSCRAFARELFSGYVGPTVESFSQAGVDVHMRSRLVDSTYSVSAAPLCYISIITPIIAPWFPLPPGSLAFLCDDVASDLLEPAVEKGLTASAQAMGPLLDFFINPPRISVPAPQLPAGFILQPSGIFLRTGEVELPSSRTVPLATASGAWTNDTIDIVAQGARLTYVIADVSESVFADFCEGCTNGGTCHAFCEGLCSPWRCDLTRAKFCFALDPAAPPCTDGMVIDPDRLEDLLPFMSTPQTRAAVRANWYGFASPIPSSPNLAAVLDGAPFLATTVQGLFTEPLDAEFHGAAYYTDILWCPAGPGRPDLCPDGSLGPVFMFEVNSDGDTIPDHADNCPTDSSNGNVNPDGDYWCNEHDQCPWTVTSIDSAAPCSCDIDGDGCRNPLELQPIPDAPSFVPRYCYTSAVGGWYDERPTLSDGGEDRDGDGSSSDCDVDDDGDGVLDHFDNCPEQMNADQADHNDDGFGDACDPLCSSASSCIDPGEIDPSLLPVGRYIDFDFGFGLVPACVADECGGFFRVTCAGFSGTGKLAECTGIRIDRWLAGSMLPIAELDDVVGLASLGDATADGVMDLVVAIRGANGGGKLRALDGASGAKLWQVTSGAAGFGASLAVGDNFVAVGAPEYRKTPSSPAVGAVLLYGADGSSLGAPIAGTVAGGRFGASLAVTDEALFVAAAGTPSAKIASGLWSLSSPTKAPKLVLDGQALQMPFGDVAPVAIGKSLVVAAPDYLDTGAVLVVERFGADLGDVIAVVAGQPGSRLGSSISQAADFDGNGLREVAVGAPGSDDWRGTVLFVSGAGAVEQSGLAGPVGAELGTSLARVGDLDGDGLADLAVGLGGFAMGGPSASGSHVVFGRTTSKLP